MLDLRALSGGHVHQRLAEADGFLPLLQVALHDGVAQGRVKARPDDRPRQLVSPDEVREGATNVDSDQLRHAAMIARPRSAAYGPMAQSSRVICADGIMTRWRA